MVGMRTWKKAPPELVKTFEHVIVGVPGAQARKMFGYPAAFVNGQMFSGVFQNRMFVRLPEPGKIELIKLGGRPFEPMPGRPMKEYVEVPPALLRSQHALAGWVRRAFDYASSLPPKGTGSAQAASKTGTEPRSKSRTTKTAGRAPGRKRLL